MIHKALVNKLVGPNSSQWKVERADKDILYLVGTSSNVANAEKIRVIPTPLIEKVYAALCRGDITREEIATGKGGAGVHFFDKLGINYDKFLAGYGSTIKQICTTLDSIEAEGGEESPKLLVSFDGYTPNAGLNLQLVKSLQAKPFVVLTGASGTGKTQQAKELVEHYANSDRSNYEIVAVGADWTDNRSTLGFVNYLTGDEGEPVYQSTAILNLLLRANTDLNTPYFLILDEMNLSHVERYFADFLSVMEQRDKGQFHLHNEGESLPNSEGQSEVPETLAFPRNLFVIGTVNIDETTYMFSPKVLDRANVIEYKVSASELEEFLNDPQEPTEIVEAEVGEAGQFLSLALATRGEVGMLETLSKEVSVMINENVLTLFNLMQAGRYEFAYRTANEMMRYMRVSRHLASDKDVWDESGWKVSLDEQIVQKILPKLHGSIGRVGKLIAQLTHFTYDSTVDLERLSDRLQDAITLEGEGSYKISFAKLQSMSKTLKDEQFVSFI